MSLDESGQSRGEACWIVLLAACAALGCGACSGNGGSGGGGNGGSSGSVEIELGRGNHRATTFEPYGDEPLVDLVHGRQGGWHVWPHVSMTGVSMPKEQIETDLRATVTDRSSGEELAKADPPPLSHFGWNAVDDGYVHKMSPVIFSIASPDEVDGREVQIRVQLDLIGGGRAEATTPAVIVDPQVDVGRMESESGSFRSFEETRTVPVRRDDEGEMYLRPHLRLRPRAAVPWSEEELDAEVSVSFRGAVLQGGRVERTVPHEKWSEGNDGALYQLPAQQLDTNDPNKIDGAYLRVVASVDLGTYGVARARIDAPLKMPSSE